MKALPAWVSDVSHVLTPQTLISPPQTQWLKKKKQTLEERQAAKRAKLDPASHKSAKDVMDENARKRKRELESEVSDAASSDLDLDIEKEQPLQGIKKTKKQKTKTLQPEENSEETLGEVANLTKAQQKALEKAEKRKEKRKEKASSKKQKAEVKKAHQAEFSKGLTKSAESDKEEVNEEEDEDEEADGLHPDDRLADLDVSGLVEEGQSTAPSTDANSNQSTSSVVSAASSSSSIPASGEGKSEKQTKQPKKSFPVTDESREIFQARLAAKLEALRANRKADGPDGRPARNRAELIESRRKKEAERKAAKKANRQEEREDEARQKAEEQLARIRGGSGSPSIFAPRSPESERNFNFGRVAWQDGQQLESNLSRFQESRKKKGKSDARTALDAAQKKKARVNALDEMKRKDIEEKDLWLSAKKRAQGEKVFDDVNLLKKTLKRQEKAKNKSREEWKDRQHNVTEGKEKKQKKREENLRKRRDEKGQKGKKKGGAKKPGKKVKRPGFEGTFKGK